MTASQQWSPGLMVELWGWLSRDCLILTAPLRIMLTVLMRWYCCWSPIAVFSHWHPDTSGKWQVCTVPPPLVNERRFTSFLGRVSWLPALGLFPCGRDYLPCLARPDSQSWLLLWSDSSGSSAVFFRGGGVYELIHFLYATHFSFFSFTIWKILILFSKSRPTQNQQRKTMDCCRF